MKYARRGVAVIINNEKFNDGEVRKGSQADVYELSLALTKLDFRVEVHHNCTARKMIELVREYGKRDCSDEDCFVCAIMSHGKQDAIMGVDKKLCPEKDLKDPIKQNKSLLGKPKIFFIQACRGDMSSVNIKADSAASRNKTDSTNQSGEADVFVHYSTVEGYQSYRHVGIGSWFIQALVSVLNEYGKKDELTEIARKVNNVVANLFRDKNVQISETSSTLRFKVYFKDKSEKLKLTEYKDVGFYVGDLVSKNRYGKGTMFYKDGSVYEGEWVNDERTGNGFLIDADGNQYEGQFVKDKREGNGKMCYQSGKVVVGVWVDDEPSKITEEHEEQMPVQPQIEKKTINYTNGNVYEGDLVNGQRSGKGSLLFSHGSKYEGDFLNDKMHGKGRMHYTNGDIYEGDWVEGRHTGMGKMHYTNGDIYEGEWLDDKQFGIGRMHYTKGDIYEGEWVNGRPSGKGFLHTTKGDKYTGDWVNGRKTGEGKMHYTNGDIYEGGWLDDQPSGKGKMHSTKGDIYEGEWVNGRQTGRGRMHYRNGDIYEGEWLDDKSSGQGKMQYANGKVYEGEWFHGRPSGEDNIFHL